MIGISPEVPILLFWIPKKGSADSTGAQHLLVLGLELLIFIAHFVFMYLDKANYAWKKTIALQSHNKALLLLPSVSLGGTLFFLILSFHWHFIRVRCKFNWNRLESEICLFQPPMVKKDCRLETITRNFMGEWHQKNIFYFKLWNGFVVYAEIRPILQHNQLY